MDSSEDTLALADEYEQRAIGELGPHSAHVSPWVRVPVSAPVLSRLCHLEGLLSDTVAGVSDGAPCCDTDLAPLSGVFTECYRKDEERAQKLLIRVSEAWGRTTCLQLALEAEGMKFVSHGGVQVTFCVASGAEVELLGRSPHSYTDVHAFGPLGTQGQRLAPRVTCCRPDNRPSFLPVCREGK